MKNSITLEKFNDIYNKTYDNTLKYVFLHCNSTEDVKDLVQDIYFNLYKHISKKNAKKIEDIDKYIIGIAKNTLKKYYHVKEKNKNTSSIDENEDVEMVIDSNIDLELQFITKQNIEEVWKYIETKDIKIVKIFYCYYNLGMKIYEIALEMKLNESTVKNYIYRTIEDLQRKFKKEDYKDA